jgi:hypothetical protein
MRVTHRLDSTKEEIRQDSEKSKLVKVTHFLKSTEKGTN